MSSPAAAFFVGLEPSLRFLTESNEVKMRPEVIVFNSERMEDRDTTELEGVLGGSFLRKFNVERCDSAASVSA